MFQVGRDHDTIATVPEAVEVLNNSGYGFSAALPTLEQRVTWPIVINKIALLVVMRLVCFAGRFFALIRGLRGDERAGAKKIPVSRS